MFTCNIACIACCMSVAVCECFGEAVSMVVLLGGSRHPVVGRSGHWASHLLTLSGKYVACCVNCNIRTAPKFSCIFP